MFIICLKLSILFISIIVIFGSRSQCIINVRCVVNKLDREDDFHANDSVLTIVDLAGAEREKRTGNHV